MVISPFHTQQGMKAYNLQLSMRPKISKGQSKSPASRDMITISPESRTKSMVAKISQEIVNNLAKNSPRNETADEAMSQLSQTYGQLFEVEEKTGEELAFKVVSEKKGDPSRSLSREENERIKQTLVDITQSIVYRNLSAGRI